MMHEKDRTIVEISAGIEAQMRRHGVEYLSGAASFQAEVQHHPDVTIRVAVATSHTRLVHARHVLIATGSEVAPPAGDVIRIDERVVVSSTGALNLRQLPRRLVILGAGAIGMELGCVYNSLGTEVFVADYAEKVLGFLDADVSSFLLKHFLAAGFRFRMAHRLVSCEVQAGDRARVSIQDSVSGRVETIEDVDVVLIATGRRADTKGLGLERIGIHPDRTGRIPISASFEASISLLTDGGIDRSQERVRGRRCGPGNHAGS